MCCVLYLVCIFQIVLFVMSLKCLEKGLCLSWVDLQYENKSWITQKPWECAWASPYMQCVTGLTCGQGKRRGLTSWACAAGFCLVWGWSAFSAFPKWKLPTSAASSRPDGSGWTLQCPFCLCICNWSGPNSWIPLHSSSGSRVFPGDGTFPGSSSQGLFFFFATTMQHYSWISVCPERTVID